LEGWNDWILWEGLERGRRASEDQFGEERSGNEDDGLREWREGLVWYLLKAGDGPRTLLTRRRMNHKFSGIRELVIDISCQSAPEIHSSNYSTSPKQFE
jgi:hypothetical protein